MKKNRPKLDLVPIPLHGNVNEPINNLGQRIMDVMQAFVDQEKKHGRTVTYAELVGVLEFCKFRLMDD